MRISPTCSARQRSSARKSTWCWSPQIRVSLADYAMALHAATLVKDGGTLQIGIGAFSDALSHALVLRHSDNAAFRGLLEKLGTPFRSGRSSTPSRSGSMAARRFSLTAFSP